MKGKTGIQIQANVWPYKPGSGVGRGQGERWQPGDQLEGDWAASAALSGPHAHFTDCLHPAARELST